jgi:hypothetical protein
MEGEYYFAADVSSHLVPKRQSTGRSGTRSVERRAPSAMKRNRGAKNFAFCGEQAASTVGIVPARGLVC